MNYLRKLTSRTLIGVRLIGSFGNKFLLTTQNITIKVKNEVIVFILLCKIQFKAKNCDCRNLL